MTKEPFPTPFEVISPYEENKLKKKRLQKTHQLTYKFQVSFKKLGCFFFKGSLTVNWQNCVLNNDQSHATCFVLTLIFKGS